MSTSIRPANAATAISVPRISLKSRLAEARERSPKRVDPTPAPSTDPTVVKTTPTRGLFKFFRHVAALRTASVTQVSKAHASEVYKKMEKADTE